MTKPVFDKEKIKRYFLKDDSDIKSGEESYIQSVFTDDAAEHDLKTFLAGQFDEIIAADETAADENSAGKKTEKVNLDHILHRIHYEINTRQAGKQTDKKVRKLDIVMRWSLRLAGIIVLPLVILLGIQQLNENRQQKLTWVEIKAPAWSKVNFSLPDGSTGWLNSNSTLKYSGNFTSHRQVTLDGEAFFDVHHDKKSPFVVTANEIAVKVLGTRFNINSYENEQNIEVILEEGEVVFMNTVNNTTYTMKPNDLVTYNKAQNDFTTEVVQPYKYTSWIDGKLIFRNDPLDVVANKLERWYNVDIELNVDLKENLRLRATFIDESLEEVMELIKRSLPIDYKIIEGSANPDNSFNKKKVIITLIDK